MWQGVHWDYQTILDEHYRLRATYDAILTDGAAYNFRVDGEQMDGWFVTLVPLEIARRFGAIHFESAGMVALWIYLGWFTAIAVYLLWFGLRNPRN